MPDEITVLSPATVSNVVCGFDCLGFALESPRDRMTLRKIDEPAVHIRHLDEFGLPTEPHRNVAGVALKAFLREADLQHGFEVEINKIIKPGSGIGSSAASACGAVVAANLLTDRQFSRAQLVELAMAGEMVASGARHADNLAPCIYGGFTLVRSNDPVDIIELEFPELYVTVVHPQIEIKTSEARAILPPEVPLKDAVTNWSNLGAFVTGLAKGDLDMLSRSMVDTIVEPARKQLIPMFDEVKSACIEAGAIGGGISGSGPSMFMLAADEATAQSLESVIRDIYFNTQTEIKTYISPIDRRGVVPV